jgi:two-component system OmpR family response regulator
MGKQASEVFTQAEQSTVEGRQAGPELVQPPSQRALSRSGATEATRLLLCVGIDDGDVDQLAAHGWRCHHVADVPQALQAASALRLDVLLVGDGALAGAMAQRLTALRGASGGALIVLAHQADDIDEIMALDVGADDYLPAPIHPRRLRARLSAAVRNGPRADEQSPHRLPPSLTHSLTASPPHLRAPLPMVRSGWSLDLSQALLRGNGHELRLSATQASLLALLLDSAGRVVSRGEMAYQLGLPRSESGSPRGRAVDMQLHCLRRRLQEAGITGLHIETVRGLGYCLHTRHRAQQGSAESPATRQLVAMA